MPTPNETLGLSPNTTHQNQLKKFRDLNESAQLYHGAAEHRARCEETLLCTGRADPGFGSAEAELPLTSRTIEPKPLQRTEQRCSAHSFPSPRGGPRPPNLSLPSPLSLVVRTAISGPSSGLCHHTQASRVYPEKPALPVLESVVDFSIFSPSTLPPPHPSSIPPPRIPSTGLEKEGLLHQVQVI